ncbi:MAG TPA: hypothetical protein VJY62_22015 [Bacteroidia bacterium]|nr:hypothetical protein [Bacteroidia bacterium]
MKNKTQSIVVIREEHDAVLENLIQRAHTDLKELAKKNGEHYAKRNQPNVSGDKLMNYTGVFKTGYEKVAAEISCHLQPQSHLPEGKMDIDFHKEKDAGLNKQIQNLEHEIHKSEYELGSYNPKPISNRIKLAMIVTIIIMLGDTLFNTKSFQIIGESLLFACVLSVCISIAVLAFSHIVPFLYKAAKTKFKKRVILIGSLLIVTGLFSALAVFRTTYLASHDVHISPVYFVLINLFFFIVATLLSYYILPTWQEIKQNAQKKKMLDEIEKQKSHLSQLKAEKEKNKATLHDNSKGRVRIIFYANYSNELIRKMYKETVETFKSTNLRCREDHCVPDCFSEIVSEPDMEDIMVLLNKNHKEQ